jgi:hypothetical protein
MARELLIIPMLGERLRRVVDAVEDQNANVLPAS